MVSRTSLYAKIAVGVVAVSSGAILVRLAAGASPLAAAAWRLVLASAILVPIALARGTLRTLKRRDLALGALSGAALAVHFVLWISSLGLTSVASSVLFVSTHPIFISLGSALFLGERINRSLAIGIAVALAGGALIGFGDLHLGAWTGDLLALGGGLFAAVYFLIGRRLRPHVSLVDYTAITYGTAAVLTLAACLVFRVRLVGFAPPTYLWLALLAIGPQLIGHSTFNWALRHLPATKVSVLILGEPLSAAFLAYLVFGETLTWLSALGAAILLAGITISLRGKEVTDGTKSGAGEDRVGG
jgi:drug/metabolite transporter (DMT)-like permease